MAEARMIRINLLPKRQARGTIAGRQFLLLVGALMVAAALGSVIWNIALARERDRRQAKLAETQSRIAQLQKAIGEVDNINRRKKEVEEKLKILDDLSKKRAGPVKLLDALASTIPPKVWVSDVEEAKGKAKITGHAETLDDVSDFMKGLRGAVWTSRGLGRVLEVKRDSLVTRVELTSGTGGIQDFQGSDIAYFFRNIELKNSTASPTDGRSPTSDLKFELSLDFNYAI